VHELALTENILKVVLAEAGKNGAGRITRVKLRIGAFTMVEPECVRHYFALAARDTIARGAVLEAEIVPLRLKCLSCSEEQEIPGDDLPLFACKACGSTEVRIMSGRELFIESIEVEN
jgi:hydrogenase nickel incorporation protein HypA/HybF